MFDVLIIGAGSVGTSLAAAIRSAGLNIGLVESQPAKPASSPLGWDSRIFAISSGSAAFLRQCDAWKHLDLARVQSVEQMCVWGDEGAALDFSAYQMGVPELAFILENRALQEAIWQQAIGQASTAQSNLTLFQPARCEHLHWTEEAAHLTLQDGRILQARLIVGADGADSWVRQQAGIVVNPAPYQQHGVVANFMAEKSHRGTAFQWFQPDGILALLPLPQNNVSMVWSVGLQKSAHLLQLSEQALCAEIAAAAQHKLGALQLLNKPAAFPLRRLYVPQTVKPRLALIGDAAHNIHPLAGQGINLGFGDAQQLAQVLLQRGAEQDCGNIRLLRRYERARKEDVTAMTIATDILKKLFNNDHPLLRMARNSGLAFTNRMIPLKKMLARHAMN